MRIKRTEIAKTCPQCGEDFIAMGRSATRKQFCTGDCQAIAYRKKHGLVREYPAEIASGTVGAISELRVAVDLMAKGLEVFRCLSPHSCSDLIVVVERLCYRIAVKTAYKSATGKLMVPQEKHEYDILAAVTPNDIVYMNASGTVIEPTTLSCK